MCAALHHAACNAAAHRFSQSAGVSDRSRVVLCEHIQHTESRACTSGSYFVAITLCAASRLGQYTLMPRSISIRLTKLTR